MSVKSDCNAILSKINSAIEYLDECENCIKISKGHLEEGVIISGNYYGAENIAFYNSQLPQLRSYLNNISNLCYLIIDNENAKELAASSSNASSNSSSSTSDSSSNTDMKVDSAKPVVAVGNTIKSVGNTIKSVGNKIKSRVNQLK